MQPQDHYQRLFNEKLDAALAAQVFPENKICYDFACFVKAAVVHQTEITLQCKWDTYKAICSKQPSEYNLLEMCNAMNAIEYCNEYQLRDNPSTDSYIHIKDKVKAMATTWNEIVTPIRAAISEEVQKEYDADLAKEQARAKLQGAGQPLPKKCIQFKQK